MRRVLTNVANTVYIMYVAVTMLVMNLIVEIGCFGFGLRYAISGRGAYKECIKMLHDCKITYDWFHDMVNTIWFRQD